MNNDYERKLRTDLNFAFKEVLKKFDIQDVSKRMNLAIEWMKTAGWEIDKKYIIETLEKNEEKEIV